PASPNAGGIPKIWHANGPRSPRPLVTLPTARRPRHAAGVAGDLLVAGYDAIGRLTADAKCPVRESPNRVGFRHLLATNRPGRVINYAKTALSRGIVPIAAGGPCGMREPPLQC